MIAVAAVNHLSGFRSDLRRLSRIAHDRGAVFVVDGVQAAGVVPLNVDDDGIDVLAGAGFKWLLGLHGTGYVYIRSSLWDRIQPVLPGMFAAEDNLHELRWLPSAQRYETGSLSYALFYAWTAGLEMILEIGIPAIRARVLDLTSQLIVGLRARGLTVTTPAAHVDERSAIVTFTAASQDANRDLHDRRSSEGIGISLRGGLCRVSPSFYNTGDEIDRLLSALG
jgi:selenocysteine lyase/cysteine desulfurase